MDFRSTGPSMDQSSNEIFWNAVSKCFIKEIELHGVEYLLDKKERPIFYIGQHGSALGWLALALVNRVFWSHYGVKRTPAIVFHPLVFRIPLLKSLASRFSSGFKITNFFQLIKLVEKGKVLEMGSCPESSNCNFSYDEPVAPFKFKEWIHLALRMGKDIILVVHSGTEEWQKTFKLPFSLGEISGINIPLAVRRIEKLRVKMIPYNPPYDAKDFKLFSKSEQTQIVNSECEKIREIMIEEFKNLS
jgi:hypothetical protein